MIEKNAKQLKTDATADYLHLSLCSKEPFAQVSNSSEIYDWFPS